MLETSQLKSELGFEETLNTLNVYCIRRKETPHKHFNIGNITNHPFNFTIQIPSVVIVPVFCAGSDVVVGDVLVLLGASLYAISNVSEEYIVKNLSRMEFLGMVGLIGTVISGLQL